MITPMTKLTMLIYHRDYNKFLNDLRDHGVVHVHTKKQTLQDENMKAKMSEVKHVNNVMKMLDVYRQQTTDNGQQTLTTELRNEELISFIDNKFAEIENIQQEIISLQKDDNVYAQWGKFPEERLNQIRANNWDVRFFTVPSKKYDNAWEEEFNAFLVNEVSGFSYFTTFTSKDKEVNIDAETFHFPAMTKSEIENKIEELKSELNDIKAYLTDIAEEAINRLNEYKQSVIDDANFYKVSEAAQRLADDKIMALEGWVPTEIETATIEWLNNEDIYFEASEPEKNVDNPPIKLKNRFFARLFEMIGNMYSIPTYWELDMTPFFAPFFVLFFGFCMGDLGYGALICLVTLGLIISKKLQPMQNVLWLGFFLGLGTVVMGTISGTFFGVPLLDVDIPIVNRLKTIMFKPDGLYSAFYVSLIIGVFQILFGMCLKIINLTKMHGFGAALSTVGWVILLLGGIVTFLLDGIGIPFYACMIIGAIFIFLLNGPINSIAAPFKNIGSGLWDTYNMATGLLGDVLSYIRLFALGLSGSILGLVFNDLAMNMSPDIPVVGTIVMLLILIFGHAMNIALSALSAFVHPMRLTFVEFYKNSGFVGGAKEYEPFRKN
ncbi:MAG: ATPase [Lentimicrobiaceae bacterium]|nr:ATPase [Lentimicrobiaceae bacterium]